MFANNISHKNKTKVFAAALVLGAFMLSGCGAMSTAVKKRNLEVKTQMSETIWLEPSSERTVYLQIKNTSDKDMSGLQGKINSQVQAKGYRIVSNPADAMVEDINYTMVTDVQIAERTTAEVTTDNMAALKQGTSGYKVQTSSETGNQHKYQTRIVSSANKVNLKFEEAKPVLEDQLAKSIANIL